MQSCSQRNASPGTRRFHDQIRGHDLGAAGRRREPRRGRFPGRFSRASIAIGRGRPPLVRRTNQAAKTKKAPDTRSMGCAVSASRCCTPTREASTSKRSWSRPPFRLTFADLQGSPSPMGDSIVDPGRSCEAVFRGNGRKKGLNRPAAGKTSTIQYVAGASGESGTLATEARGRSRESAPPPVAVTTSPCTRARRVTRRAGTATPIGSGWRWVSTPRPRRRPASCRGACGIRRRSSRPRAGTRRSTTTRPSRVHGGRWRRGRR